MADNEFTKAFDEAWEPFREAVARLTADDFDRTTSAGWTVKEMLAHIAFWDETAGPVLGMILGRDPAAANEGWPGFASGYDPSQDDGWPHADVHNAREAAWARTQPHEAVLDRLHKAHAYARAELAKLGPKELLNQRVRSYFYSDKPSHYMAHLPELTELTELTE